MTSGSKIDAMRMSAISSKLKSKRMKAMISPMSRNGIQTMTAVKIFAWIIVYGLTGKLFKILNDLPSSEIIELEIDDMRLETMIKPRSATGMNGYALSRLAPLAVTSGLRMSSNLIAKVTTPATNSTSPKAALVTNTGDVANLRASLPMSALIVP